MRDSTATQISVLTYLGILPFWLAIAAIFLGFDQDKAIYTLQTYGAVIVSFISGMHWSIGMQDNLSISRGLLIMSNMITLVAWGSLLIPHTLSRLIIIAVCFIILLLIDMKLLKVKQIDTGFFRLRIRATFFVVIALIVAGGALLSA